MKRLLILSGKGGTGKTTTAAAFIRFAGAKAVADCDAVSYTHLDVYKRQTRAAANTPPISGTLNPPWPESGPWTCLLYTSRCV